MLSGYSPTNSESLNEYKAKIERNITVNLNHNELWPVSFDCKSLILQSIVKSNKRPDPLVMIKSVWLEKTEQELISFEENELQFGRLVELLNKCLKYKPIEVAMRRSISRRAKIINKEYIYKLFMKFDGDYSGFFEGDEFRKIMDIPQIKKYNFD